jgi:hypothetical protein
MSENSREAGAIHDEALRIAIDGIFGFCKRFQRSQEIRHSDSGVQQLDKICRGDALALGDLQHFNDSDSTSSGLGSRDCSISLFIEPLTSVSVFMYSGQNRHSAGTLCFCAVQYCTPLQLLTWRSPRPGGGSSAWMHDRWKQATSPPTDVQFCAGTR